MLRLAVLLKEAQEFDEVRKIIVILQKLSTPAMQHRHWEEIMIGIGREGKDAMSITIRHLIQVKLHDCTSPLPFFIMASCLR